MGKYIISRQPNGKYRFQLISNGGYLILTGSGYTTKASCKKGIKSVVINSQDRSNFIRKDLANGTHRFILKTKSGETIGKSIIYGSMAGREMGIFFVQESAITELIELQ